MKSNEITLEDGEKRFRSMSPEEQRELCEEIGLENISPAFVIMSRMRREMEAQELSLQQTKPEKDGD